MLGARRESHAVIAWDRVDELRNEIGEEGFAEVIDMFMEEAEEMCDAIAAAEPADMEAAMHALKSTALNLGLSDLAAACAAGERLAAQGDPDAVDVARVLVCYRKSRQALIDGLAGGQAAQ
jgi:HPt (histidine-containing phosphotransfer) domain-containing protein